MTTEALKLANQNVLAKFSENLKDLSPVAEFMPKSSQDVLAYINYWENKKKDPETGTWDLKTINDQIYKLERIMMAGTDLAIDFMGDVDDTELKPVQEKIYPEKSVEDRSKLPTLEEVRSNIKNIFKEKGKDEAEKYGRNMLHKNNYREGETILPVSRDKMIEEAIKEAENASKPDPKSPEKKEKTKTVDKNKELERIKNIYPELGDNITDEMCNLIDAYENVILQGKKYDKKNEVHNKELPKKNEVTFKKAEEKWNKLSDKKKDNIRKNALKNYNSLPSEDKSRLTEEEFTICHYANSFPEEEANSLVDFCRPKETIEEERQAMKDIQEKVSALLKDNKENEARAVSKLFFGNFAQAKTFASQRGRNYSDQNFADWFHWVKNGCKNGEWHEYLRTMKKEKTENNQKVEEAKKEKEKIKIENSNIPEQLKADLSELIEKELENKKKLSQIAKEARKLYEQHKREFKLGEFSTIAKSVKASIQKESDTKDSEEESKSKAPEEIQNEQSIFVRQSLSETNPELAEKAKSIASLDGLSKFVKDNAISWRDTTNLAFEVIDDNKQIEEAKDWTEKQIEDHVGKYLINVDQPPDEPKKEKEERKIMDMSILDKVKSKNKIRKSVKRLLQEYGAYKDVRYNIARKLQSAKEGYSSHFHGKNLEEIKKFVDNVAKVWRIDVLDENAPLIT